MVIVLGMPWTVFSADEQAQKIEASQESVTITSCSDTTASQFPRYESWFLVRMLIEMIDLECRGLIRSWCTTCDSIGPSLSAYSLH